MKLYKREKYLKRIRPFYDITDLIKVISGIRRCGKSTLMQTIADELKSNGVKNDNIIYYNLDKHNYRDITNADKFDELLFSSNKPKGLKYIFIDEIQNVENFEPVINSLREEGDYSIFITGSNSYLLSGELATKLTGRYIEFDLFPLTFDEYEEMKKLYNKPINSKESIEFDEFLRVGGFPESIKIDEPINKQFYIKGVLSDILIKDIKRRIRINNIEAFNIVQNYIINNYGATTNISNICSDLSNAGISIKRSTISKYIQALIDAKIIYECNRFDMKSRKSLKNEKKYYLADTSLYFANNVDQRFNYGPVLENIIFTYAKSMRYDVNVGKVGATECDFILRDVQNNYSYVQVAYTILNSIKTEDREYRPLEKILDNYPKYVMTCDYLIQKRNGIIHSNIIDFIANQQTF